MKPIRAALLALLAASCTSVDRPAAGPAKCGPDVPSFAAMAARRPMPGDPDTLPVRDAGTGAEGNVVPQPIATSVAPVRYASVASSADRDGPAIRSASEPRKADTPGPVATRVAVGSTELVRGEGAAPQPAPSAVAGHPMLPVWDDALGARPAGVKLCWGESELVLNLYDPPRSTPQQLEFSLDGGPWVAARYGRVVVPDLGIGTYQVRCVAYPARGTSWVMEPVLIERTARGWRTAETITSSAR